MYLSRMGIEAVTERDAFGLWAERVAYFIYDRNPFTDSGGYLLQWWWILDTLGLSMNYLRRPYLNERNEMEFHRNGFVLV